jgi:hypothetical protein
MAEPAQGAASPEAAWRKGAKQAEQGDYAGALRWLERAVRLAPADPRIALDLANIRLLAGGPDQITRAAAAFAALASRYDTIRLLARPAGGQAACRRSRRCRRGAARPAVTPLRAGRCRFPGGRDNRR